jgi:hypothetical protein
MFLDACFSGLARGESPLASRGVIIRPKAVQAAGNTVVFSAAGIAKILFVVFLVIAVVTFILGQGRRT